MLRTKIEAYTRQRFQKPRHVKFIHLADIVEQYIRILPGTVFVKRTARQSNVTPESGAHTLNFPTHLRGIFQRPKLFHFNLQVGQVEKGQISGHKPRLACPLPS